MAWEPSKTGVSCGCFRIKVVTGFVLTTPGVTPRNCTSEICMLLAVPGALTTVGKMRR